MSALEVLRKAREALVTRGWHQGDYGSDKARPDTCAVCAVGAIGVAITGSPFRWEPGVPRAIWAIVSLLKHATGYHGRLFGDGWNDVPGRTVEEVLAAFDQAIATEEARGAP